MGVNWHEIQRQRDIDQENARRFGNERVAIWAGIIMGFALSAPFWVGVFLVVRGLIG